MTTLTEKLQDKCQLIQVSMGLDDIKWKRKYGNDNGLFGFVGEALATALRGLQMPEKKKTIGDMNQLERIERITRNEAIDECQAVITAFAESLVKG